MKKNEIKILKNEDFIRRLMKYTYANNSELIATAWLDTSPKTINDTAFSPDFEIIACAIIEASKNEGD